MRRVAWALVAMVACGSHHRDAPRRDDAALRGRDAATAAPAIDCPTAMWWLRRLETASVEAGIKDVAPLAHSLDAFGNFDQFGLPSAKVDLDAVKQDVANALEDQWPELLAAATVECVASAWPAEARACFARVTKEADAEACDKLLTGTQVRRMTAVVMRVTAAHDGGDEQHRARWKKRIERVLSPDECHMYELYAIEAGRCAKLPKRERDAIAADFATTSAGWNLDGDTDALAAPCETAAQRLATRFDAAGCKLFDRP